MALHYTETGRQPSRLPFGFRAWLIAVYVMAIVPYGGASKLARAERGDIVIVAVDSSRLPDPDGPDARQPIAYPIRDGVEEVAHDINLRGGLLGRRLTVVYENDQCEPDEAVAVAGRAVARGASVVIGHVCSSAAIRAAAIYADANLVMIATGPRHPRLTSPTARRGIHRLAGRDDRQAESIAALFASVFAEARVAIVHDQSLLGRSMADEIRRSAVAAKAPPALVTAYTAGKKDYAAIVEQLAAAKVNLITFPGQPFEASIILDQAQSAGARVATVIGTDVLAGEAAPKRLLDATDEFLVMLAWPGMGPDAGRLQDAKLATERLLAGAAVEVWSQAVGDVQSAASESVNAALRRPGWKTRVGIIHFNEQGDAAVPSFLPHVWREGRWVLRR